MSESTWSRSHWPTSSGPRSPAASTANRRPSTIRAPRATGSTPRRSEEHTSELQSLMRISYAVFCLKKKQKPTTKQIYQLRVNQTESLRLHQLRVIHEPVTKDHSII